MQQQSDHQIESFVPRFVQFINDVRRTAGTLRFGPDTVDRFSILERNLTDCCESSRQLAIELAEAESLVHQKRLQLLRAQSERDTAYRNATTGAQLLLAAIEQQPQVTPGFVQQLKITLGLLQVTPPVPTVTPVTPVNTAHPVTTASEEPILLAVPTNLSVQRHDSGVIGLSWEYDAYDKDTQFEIAIAVGDGFWRGKPREPELSSSTPEAWPERVQVSDRSFIYSIKAKNGADIRVDTITWFKVRAVRGQNSKSEWTKLLEVVCHPATAGITETVTDAPKGGAFNFFGRRPA